MKKLLALILSFAMLTAMVVSLASCAEEESVDVGIVLRTKEEPRWLQDEASFKDALDKAGFTSEVLFSQGDSQKELTNVETLVEDGVKVLVICAQDAAAAGQAVQNMNIMFGFDETEGLMGIPMAF